MLVLFSKYCVFKYVRLILGHKDSRIFKTTNVLMLSITHRKHTIHMFIYDDKMKNKNTTLSEHFQIPIEKS
jgi:hypothetical protein